MKSIIEKIKPKYFYDDKGNKLAVYLTKKEFEKLMDTFEELHDYKLALERVAKKEKTYSREEVRNATLARIKKL